MRPPEPDQKGTSWHSGAFRFWIDGLVRTSGQVAYDRDMRERHCCICNGAIIKLVVLCPKVADVFEWFKRSCLAFQGAYALCRTKSKAHAASFT